MAIKTITVYECSDKRRFDDEKKAFNHEQEVQKVRDYLRQYIGTKRPEPNGSEFIQHPAGTKLAMTALYQKRGVHPRVDDDSNSPWYAFYTRMESIDSLDREWGQIAYARTGNMSAKPVARVP